MSREGERWGGKNEKEREGERQIQEQGQRQKQRWNAGSSSLNQSDG